jgi:hypothetical protein
LTFQDHHITAAAAQPVTKSQTHDSCVFASLRIGCIFTTPTVRSRASQGHLIASPVKPISPPSAGGIDLTE